MSATEKVRFAYVGCGFFAQHIHIPNFRALPDCDFRAIAEVRPGLGQRVAEYYGIPQVYRDHMDIANDPDIEAVGVSGPYALQGRIAEDLIRAGKNVIMEKPMAVSAERAKSIVKAVQSAKGKARLMVAYMKRYDAGNVLLKSHLDAWRKAGDVGRLVLARNHGFGGNWIYAKDPNIPFFTSPDAAPPAPDESPAWLPDRWRRPYLEYLQQWTHNLNLLRFFLADENGVAKTTVKTVQLDSDGLTGVVVLDINGHRAVLESSYTRFHAWDEHTQIYFEGGWLRTQAPALTHKETPATVEIYRAGQGETPARAIQEFAVPSWSYREEAKHFLKCVRSGEPFHSSAEDTLNDVQLYEDIYRVFLNL